jgi:hypothetical protein
MMLKKIFTRVRIFIFLSRKAQFFFPKFNIRLYDKNSESNYLVFLHQNQNIFLSNIGNQNIFFNLGFVSLISSSCEYIFWKNALFVLLFILFIFFTSPEIIHFKKTIYKIKKCGRTPQQNPIKKDQWENHLTNLLKENETISDSKFDFKTDTYIEKLNSPIK